MQKISFFEKHFLYLKLEDNSKYGNKLISSLSKEIRLVYHGITGFSEKNLRRMKRFYNEYKDTDEKVPQLVAQLPWGHNVLLFKDRLIVKWSLNGVNAPIGVSSYELSKYISQDTIKNYQRKRILIFL